MSDPLINRGTPTVSIIIPSWDGHRDGCVPRLLASIESQTFKDVEILMVEGVSPQGKAINQGAGKARGKILVIVDDDSRLADECVLQKLIDVVEGDSTVGMAGASIVLPPESTPFQQRAALQFPRFNVPVVEEITESDLACHGCCAIPASVFHEIGREREDIIRGLDPDMRVRLRNAGYRVVLAPDTRIYHPLPDGWARLGRLFFRNGFGSAYARKFRPDSVYETHESLRSDNFQASTPFPFRLIRFPFRLLQAIIQGKFMRFYAYAVYACGYVWGTFTAREQDMAPASAGKST